MNYDSETMLPTLYEAIAKLDPRERHVVLEKLAGKTFNQIKLAPFCHNKVSEANGGVRNETKRRCFRIACSKIKRYLKNKKYYYDSSPQSHGI